MEVEELLKEYSDELYSKMPNFFQYLEVINAIAGYFAQIENYMFEEIEYSEDYNFNVDFISLTEMCNQILNSLDTGLCKKFNKRMYDGTINFEEDSITSMKVDNGKIDITLNRNYTIEDIFGLIHEFFHSIHIEKYNNNMHDSKWYIFTEAIAMIGELYAVLYMYKNNIMKEDLIIYIKKYLSTIFAQANNTLVTGLALEIYDKEQSLSDDSIEHFIKVKELPSEYKNINHVLEYLDDFLFHESATYTFGFPISFIVVTKMFEDDCYKNKVISLLENINDYSLEDLLTSLGIGDILKNENFICSSMNYVYEISKQLINEEQLDVKRHLLEMR